MNTINITDRKFNCDFHCNSMAPPSFNVMMFLRGIETLSGDATLSSLFLSPSEKWSTLRGKNLLPLGANSFLYRIDPFSEGEFHAMNKEEVTEIVSYCKNGEQSTNCIISP